MEPVPPIAASQPGDGLTVAIADMVGKQPAPLVPRLQHLDETAQPSPAWQAVRRLGNGLLYGTASFGVAALLELAASNGGGGQHGLVAGCVAALGFCSGVFAPLTPKRTEEIDELLSSGGAVLTLMALNAELSPAARESFLGVGSFHLDHPTYLTLLFDKRKFDPEHAEEVVAAVQTQLMKHDLVGLAPEFVKFKISFARPG